MSRTRRLITAGALIALMVAFGFGVNRFIGVFQSKAISEAPTKPTNEKPQFQLPGAIYVADEGALYKLSGGQFTELETPGQWLQPSLLPDGNLLVVKETSHYYSDIYEISTEGAIVKQLSHFGVKTPANGDLSGNHWAFYPRMGPDGNIYFSLDQPKAGYQVDLSIWASSPADVGTRHMQRWSQPNYYTGGDVSPLPLQNGGLLYVKYGITGGDKAYSRIFYKAGDKNPDSDGTAETTTNENCSQPSLSASNMLAMICSPSTSEADLVVAPLNSDGSLGKFKVLVSGNMCAAPTWSPDGKSLIFYAPSSNGSGYFQLWWIDNAGTSNPAAPRELTTNLDLDSTSPPAWAAG